MRVLFVNDYGYLFGGAEVYAEGLARALVARGHEVRWLTARSRWPAGAPLNRRRPSLRSDRRDFHDDYFCAEASHNNRLLRGLQQVFNPGARQALWMILKEWAPDVVHLHNYLGRLSPSILEVLDGLPTVATLHNYRALCPKGTKELPDHSPCFSPWGRYCVESGCVKVATYLQETLKRALWGSSLRGIRRLLAPSVFMKKLVERETALPVEVVPCATDLHEYRIAKRNGLGRVLYAGRLVSPKGVHHLLGAFAEVLRELPTASLLIAGEGPERCRLEQQAAELGLGMRARFLGQCSREALIALHAEVDICIVPSLWPENCPVAIVEALALGTPVIASAVGGSPELVRDGLNGRLVPPGNVSRLRKAMVELLARPRRRQAMERGSLFTAEAFRLCEAAEQMESIYEEALDTPAF